MIVSHRHKFIFLKTNKTAGTSIEIALSSYCGPEDIITPISDEDEKIRLNLGYPGPQNCKLESIVRSGSSRDGVQEYYNHMPAQEIMLLLGPEVWNSYFKFCFERNPWDRAVSLYYWIHGSKPHVQFSEFLLSDDLLRLKRYGFDVYTVDGTVAVDRICRYEHLAEEFERIRAKLRLLDHEVILPSAKSRFRQRGKSYQSYYNEAERLLIARRFEQEIALLDYHF